MAKRTNPFIEDFVPQSKMHVGIKQFNNNEDRLKKVYEKTLLLLFRGAKKCPTADVCNPEDSNRTDTMATNDKHGRMKQLFIGKDGTLLHIGNMVNSTVNGIGIKQCSCGSGGESQCASVGTLRFTSQFTLASQLRLGCALSASTTVSAVRKHTAYIVLPSDWKILKSAYLVTVKK